MDANNYRRLSRNLARVYRHILDYPGHEVRMLLVLEGFDRALDCFMTEMMLDNPEGFSRTKFLEPLVEIDKTRRKPVLPSEGGNADANV